jgi:hypothetical protein
MKLILLILTLLTVLACGDRDGGRSSSIKYYKDGPRGGCYYINSNGNKTYVDRSYCN